MDRAERKAAAEILDTGNVLQAHLTHSLYRVAHYQREGLTDKEYAYLMARHKAVELEMQKMTKLVHRLRHHG